MIRPCVEADFDIIRAIINEAAEVYRGAIPADCWHEPYMTGASLQAEIDSGIKFWGWDESASLAGVMGIQHVRDVTLIRHAYVRTISQGRGIGSALLRFVEDDIRQLQGRQLLIETSSLPHYDLTRRFYLKHTYQLAASVPVRLAPVRVTVLPLPTFGSLNVAVPPVRLTSSPVILPLTVVVCTAAELLPS